MYYIDKLDFWPDDGARELIREAANSAGFIHRGTRVSLQMSWQRSSVATKVVPLLAKLAQLRDFHYTGELALQELFIQGYHNRQTAPTILVEYVFSYHLTAQSESI